MRRPVSTPRGLKPSKIAVKSGVVGDFVLPAAPEDSQPSASEGADRMRMVLASVAGSAVDLLGPRMPVAGGGREGCHRAPPAPVAGGPGSGRPALAPLPRGPAHA